ncbi:MAG: glycosyltransferase [Geodermatophilaceae bacterium]|nr:glycosyltransferase [Geodermatophilaceae bacterium]MDQ3456498.1 glycosyltransferase [Actinomycetota bacterium]
MAGVAVIIPAKNEDERIAATVTAAWLIPGVDLVVVVDDGSTDDTAAIALAAEAWVVVHPQNRGKAAAMRSGADAVAELDAPNEERALLFIDADLGPTATHCAPLVGPVLAGLADMTIALLPTPHEVAGGRGRVVELARAGISRATGWVATQPLSGIRCLTRRAFEAALPLAAGWGVETALTIDLLRRGLQVEEVPCDLQHRVTLDDLAGRLHRAAQYRDVVRALAVRGVISVRPVRRTSIAVRRG